MKVKYLNNKGKEIEAGYELPDSIFAIRINEALLAQYVYAHNSNQRQSNAQTKDRGEVAGGGRKPWNQKGTGRARAGSIRSPIWRGGGVTFGPSNDRNYKKALTKKMVKIAFRSALSLAAKENKLAVMEKLEIKTIDAKNILSILKTQLTNGKVLLVQNGSNKELIMSARNLKEINVINVKELNAYNVLNTKQIILLEDAVEYINSTWVGKSRKIKKIVKKSVSSEKKSEVVKKPIKKSASKEVKKIVKKVK